jgi:endonuclease YncB( thermonuclease family)
MFGFNKTTFLTEQEEKRNDPSVRIRDPLYTNKSFRVSPKDIVVVDADSFDFTGGPYKGYEPIRGTDGITRLLGADSPETSVFDKYNAKTQKEKSEARKLHDKRVREQGQEYKASAYVTQDFGIESTVAAKEFINSSEYINVTLGEVDYYGRRLVEIHNEEGEALSNHLIEQGLAFAETPYGKYFEPTEENFERYDLMVEAYKQGKGIFSKDDFVLPSDFRKGDLTNPFKRELDIAIRMESFRERGLGNTEYAYILADEDTYFTLPASLGASAHYGRSLQANLMEQNGYNNLARDQPFMGIAESMMTYNKVMLQGEANFVFGEKFTAKLYDRGLHAGGLGNWLNREVFMPMGWGRVYKDEKGALPSIAGLAGKILDESYLYYANMNPEYTLIGHDYKEGLGLGAFEQPSGMFQTIFEDTTSFGISVAQSLVLLNLLTLLNLNLWQSFILETWQDTTQNLED